MGDAAWHRGQLVERLRELAKQDADVFPVEDSINTLAADRIEALEAEKREAALEALAAQSQAFEHYERIKALEKELAATKERLSEERDIWDRMLGDAADKFAHLEREIDDCVYVLDALWDKRCDKIVTQKWAEILIRNKRVTGASSAEDSSDQTTE